MSVLEIDRASRLIVGLWLGFVVVSSALMFLDALDELAWRIAKLERESRSVNEKQET